MLPIQGGKQTAEPNGSVGSADKTGSGLYNTSTAGQATGSGGGIIFNNTFGDGATAAFKTAVLAAESVLQGEFTNAVTLNLRFDLSPLDPAFAGQNSYNPILVSYAAFKAALASHASTVHQKATIAALPVTDPSNGAGFAVAAGEARVLGLAGTSQETDDTIVLNSNLPWTYGQDAIGVLEHEISEGAMGRFGGLGVSNGIWGPMDLFRFSSGGQRDYTGGKDGLATYYSNNGQVLMLQYHSPISATGVNDGFDLADWDQTRGDAFGPGGPGGPGTLSATDVQVMEVLGWTPSTFAEPGNLSVSTAGVTFDLETLTARSSFGVTPVQAGGGSLIGSAYNDTLIVGANEGSYTFNGSLGNNTVSVDGVGRVGTDISGGGHDGITIAITATTIYAVNTQQIQFIDGTVEYDPAGFGAQVMRLYEAALGQAPDAPGLAYWTDALSAGTSLTALAEQFVGSPVFQARFPDAGRNTSSFVTELYSKVLSRAPAASDLAAWGRAISHGGMTTAQVLVGFSESSEYKVITSPMIQSGLYVANQQAAQVARLYYATLQRAPDFIGFRPWLDALQRGNLDLRQEADLFCSSKEFLGRHDNLDNLDFVDLLYTGVLHRSPDAAGAAAWTTALNNGSATRSGVVLGFSQSRELITGLAPMIESHGITFG